MADDRGAFRYTIEVDPKTGKVRVVNQELDKLSKTMDGVARNTDRAKKSQDFLTEAQNRFIPVASRVLAAMIAFRPITFVAAKVSMRLISVAGVGIGIVSKSHR